MHIETMEYVHDLTDKKMGPSDTAIVKQQAKGEEDTMVPCFYPDAVWANSSRAHMKVSKLAQVHF